MSGLPAAEGPGAADGASAVVGRAAGVPAIVALGAAVVVTAVCVSDVVGRAAGVPAVKALGAAVGVAAVFERGASVPAVVALGAVVSVAAVGVVPVIVAAFVGCAAGVRAVGSPPLWSADAGVVRVAGAAAEALRAPVSAVVVVGRTRRATTGVAAADAALPEGAADWATPPPVGGRG